MNYERTGYDLCAAPTGSRDKFGSCSEQTQSRGPGATLLALSMVCHPPPWIPGQAREASGLGVETNCDTHQFKRGRPLGPKFLCRVHFMDINFLAVGRLKGPEQELCDRYLSRIGSIGRSLGIAKCSFEVINEARAGSVGVRKKQESEALLKKISDKTVLVALDEHGKSLRSEKFASQIARFRDRGVPGLVFVLGGPDGHGEGVLQRAELTLSLSAMTMPHGLARAVLCEQVYRALTILANHPYHRN